MIQSSGISRAIPERLDTIVGITTALRIAGRQDYMTFPDTTVP